MGVIWGVKIALEIFILVVHSSVFKRKTVGRLLIDLIAMIPSFFMAIQCH